jgi:hypothetical protein
MLNTDWAMRSYFKPAPRSLWDEMFLRHDRERENLMRWEATKSGLTRTISMETLRVAAGSTSGSVSESWSGVLVAPEDAQSVSGPLSDAAREKRKREDVEGGSWPNKTSTRSLPPRSDTECSVDGSALDDSEFEEQLAQVDMWRARIASPTPSSSITPSGHVPEHPLSPGSSIDSQWDLLDSSDGELVDSPCISDDDNE